MTHMDGFGFTYIAITEMIWRSRTAVIKENSQTLTIRKCGKWKLLNFNTPKARRKSD